MYRKQVIGCNTHTYTHVPMHKRLLDENNNVDMPYKQRVSRVGGRTRGMSIVHPVSGHS